MRGTLSINLFIRTAPIIALIIALIGGLAFYSTNKEINTVYDAQLITDANVLWTLISNDLNSTESKSARLVEDIDLTDDNQLVVNAPAADYADSRMFRVWKGKKLLMYSDTAIPANDIGMQPAGFSILTYQNEDWRIYTLPISEKNVFIEVGEKLQLRNALVENILFNLAWPLILLVPLVAVLLWFGIRNGLESIRWLVGQIRSRSPDDLSHVNADDLPKDLAPLGNSLNQLFTKLEHSFEAEKRFTDHAAHQLATPQAAIKLQLQMLTKASGEREKSEIIAELIASNDRAARLINMLLASARLSHQPINRHPVGLYPLIASVMAELGVFARQKKIELSLAGDEKAIALADDTLFKLLIHNLVDNAIKYTPAHGSVSLTLKVQNNHCIITILDTGCGIADSEKNMVFERFYRIGTPEVEGSGLGLAMVAGIIDRLSGKISLKTPESGIGLQVEVALPCPKS